MNTFLNFFAIVSQTYCSCKLFFREINEMYLGDCAQGCFF